MHDRRVAREKPAVPDGRGCRFGIVVITLHDDVAAGDDLAQRLAVSRYIVAVLVHDPYDSGPEHVHALPRLDAGALARGQLLVDRARFADGDQRRRLGEPVGMGQLPAEFALDGLDGGRCRRRARGEEPYPARRAGP